MLKWAITPRISNEFFDQTSTNGSHDSIELLTLQAIIEQHQLPCLVRFVNDDLYDSFDNYCLLLCETKDPYLIVSNETERFSIPISFDGLFAPVEHGITRYNILQSVQALQNYFKVSSSIDPNETLSFTTLESCMAYNHSSSRPLSPGMRLEVCHTPIISSISASATSHRLRSLFSNIPHSLTKHRSMSHHQSRITKASLSNDYLEVRSIDIGEHFYLKNNSLGLFVPIQTKVSSLQSRPKFSDSPRISSLSSNQIQGLFTVNLLSKLSKQYPLISELVVSQTIEENVPKTVGYPCRLVTIHRLVEDHTRIIAFDMKNYAFVEIDPTNNIDSYAIEHDDALFQRYQAQLRWCEKHLPSFRSQIKSIVHSSTGSATFIQATPFYGQQLQPYHQRRNSSSIITTPLNKQIPRTIFTSQESIVFNRIRSRTPKSSKFHTTSNIFKYESKTEGKQKSSNNHGPTRKDVRVYFDDPTIKKNLQTKSTIKQTSFHQKNSTSVASSKEGTSSVSNVDAHNSFECTSL